MNENNPKKVFVGLSGGVDSAVSAALLKKDGYEVTGVFIEVWQPDWIECNWREDRRDAMRVAAHLGIPFINLDLREEYKKGVIDYMIEEYRAGRTPNPDVMCNREVKFGAFWKWAEQNGADFVATGHYARKETRSMEHGARSMEQEARNTEQGERRTARPQRFACEASRENGERGSAESKYFLLKGEDANKDQSYFLWTLNQSDLSHILFPVGHLLKPQVRELAKKFGLPNFDKKDSQGLCFIGKIDLKDFLAHYIKTEEGNVLNEKGEIIGKHPGALFFTIGERHGFAIDKKTPNDLPYYVVGKNMTENTVTVRKAGGIDQNPEGNICKLTNVNWISGTASELNQELTARTRYRQELQKIKIKSISDRVAEIEFDRPQESLTPGQSLVIYNSDECLGGGIIQ